MKTRGTKIFFILCTVIVIILTNCSTALAKSQNGYQPQGLFNLQFVMNVSWSGNETGEPISPGETREVNITISYLVTRGLYGTLLLQFLKGKSFPIQLSIEDKPDWCEAWTLPENMTGVIAPDEVGVQYSSLFIHLNDDAPSNYTLGYVKIRCIAEDKKGPFNIFTLVHGYDNDFTIPFITDP